MKQDMIMKITSIVLVVYVLSLPISMLANSLLPFFISSGALLFMLMVIMIDLCWSTA